MRSSADVSATPDSARGDGDAVRTIAYRRSLRASRGRRAAAAVRRRRVLRSRGSLLVASAALMLASGGAIAAQQSGSQPGLLSSDTIAEVQRELDVEADGIIGPITRAAARRFQRSNGLIADGVIGPQTLAALGIEPDAGDGVRLRAASVGDSVLERIAACESGHDPTAVSADGRYRGKYQFSWATWRMVGGVGDPAQAAEAVQDRLAARLLRRAGTSPWPNCA